MCYPYARRAQDAQNAAVITPTQAAHRWAATHRAPRREDIDVTAKSARANPDKPWVGYGTIGLVVGVMIASFWFSFTSITDAASWSGNVHETLWLAAVFIDGPLLTYTVVRAVRKWRGESAIASGFGLYGFTGVSVAINFAHTTAYWSWNLATPESLFGVLISISAPIGALLASEQVVALAFDRRPRKKKAVAPEFLPADDNLIQPADPTAELEAVFASPAYPPMPHPGADDGLPEVF